MLSESRNSTCTGVAKNLVSEKTGFVMAVILAKRREGGGDRIHTKCSGTWSIHSQEQFVNSRIHIALPQTDIPRRIPPSTSAITFGWWIFCRTSESKLAVATMIPSSRKEDDIQNASSELRHADWPTWIIHSRKGSAKLTAVGSFPLSKPPYISIKRTSARIISHVWPGEKSTWSAAALVKLIIVLENSDMKEPSRPLKQGIGKKGLECSVDNRGHAIVN